MNNVSKNTHILVTGAAGFIGSHLVDSLLEQGAYVVGVDNLSTGSRSNLQQAERDPNFSFITADVTTDPTTYLPDDFYPDLVYHMASPASPPQYQRLPIATYLVNSHATHLLLSWLRQTQPLSDKTATFLFASTSEIYGDPLVHPQPETYWGNVNPNGPRSCYDEAKRLGEAICGVFHREFDFDTRIVRIFNTYGPRLNAEDGRVIPNFIAQAKAGIPYTLYGTGAQTRSYCYVDDLVAGLLEFGSKPSLAGTTINLGNPDEYSVLETASIVHEVFSTGEFKTLEQELPTDDPVRRKPDISLAQNLLGWSPAISLREGLEQMKHEIS